MGRSPLEDVAFLNQPLAPREGPGRSSAIHQAAGQAAAFWTPLAPLVTPELAYALLWPAVAAFRPDQDPKGPQDWTSHLWQAICRYWPRELAKAPKASPSEDPRAQVAERQKTLLTSMVEGVSRWSHEGIPSDCDARELWVQRHVMLIESERSRIYLLRPDGYYDTTPLAPMSLIPAIRARGLDELIPLSSGEGRPLSADHLLRDFAVPFSSKHVFANIASAQGHPGGILRPSKQGQDPELHLSYFSRRADLTPQFDPDVDAWLRALAGPKFEALERWLSYVLDFKKTTAALALYGASSVGKKMLLRGLTECIYPGTSADSRAFGKFNEQLLKTPFLFVDEGFAASVPKEDRATQFRRLIDGESQTIEVKHQTPFQASIPVRMVFTANNSTFADEIAGGRELTPDDEKAIALRTLIIPVAPGAAEYLAQRGGIQHTRGWVAPDFTSSAQDPGDLRIARHILHLFEARHRYAEGNRLAVEGDPADVQLFRSLQTRSESGERVLDVLYDLVELAANRSPRGVLYRSDSDPAQSRGGAHPRPGFFVTADAIHRQMGTVAFKTGVKPPSLKRITQILKHYASATGCRIRKGDHTRYAELDLHKLAEHAEECGRDTRVLEEMMQGTFKQAPSPEEPDLSKGTLSKLLSPDPEKVN